MTKSAQLDAESTDNEAPVGALCLSCNYVLTGIPSQRCPECGRPFDPEDSTSINLSGVKRGAVARRIALGRHDPPSLLIAISNGYLARYVNGPAVVLFLFGVASVPSVIDTTLLFRWLFRLWLAVGLAWAAAGVLSLVAYAIVRDSGLARPHRLAPFALAPALAIVFAYSIKEGYVLPARPVFHNELRRAYKAPKSSRPVWDSCRPGIGIDHDVSYADYSHNYLVVIAGHSSSEAQDLGYFAPYRCTQSEARILVANAEATLAIQRDTAVLIGRDGIITTNRIARGQARQIHQRALASTEQLQDVVRGVGIAFDPAPWPSRPTPR